MRSVKRYKKPCLFADPTVKREMNLNVSSYARYFARHILEAQESLRMSLFSLYLLVNKRAKKSGRSRLKNIRLHFDLFLGSLFVIGSGFALVSDGQKRFATFSNQLVQQKPTVDLSWNSENICNYSPYFYIVELAQELLEKEQIIPLSDVISALREDTGWGACYVLNVLSTPRAGLVLYADQKGVWITRYSRIAFKS